MLYGLTPDMNLVNMATRVCDVLGHGRHRKAVNLLLETTAAETQFGTFPDTTTESGHGITQFDRIGFEDTQRRTRLSDKRKIQKEFGYNISRVKIKELDEDPLLSLIFCRLKYKLRTEEIPDDLVSRAVYWKRFYNSSMGKGTVEHYLHSAETHLYNPGLITC